MRLGGEEKKTKHLYVKATYNGFNSGADAYVFFKEEKTVEVVGASGYFTQSDPSNKLIQLRRYENPVLDSIRNVYQQQGLLLIIDAGLDTEKRRNLENGSKIKATYP